MLEPVQERDDHPVPDDLGIDALQRIAEVRGLDRDQQEGHRLHELFDDRRVDVHRLEPVRLERDPRQRHQADGLGRTDTDRAVVGLREAHRERPADCTGAQDSDGLRHVNAGSAIRFTTFQSEYTSSASIPASRHPFRSS